MKATYVILLVLFIAIAMGCAKRASTSGTGTSTSASTTDDEVVEETTGDPGESVFVGPGGDL